VKLRVAWCAPGNCPRRRDGLASS